MDYCCTYIAEPSNPYPDAALAPPPVPSPLGAAGSSARHTGHYRLLASHVRMHWSWNRCPHGSRLHVVPISMSTRHTGHFASSLSLSTTPSITSEGKFATNVGHVGAWNDRVSNSARFTSGGPFHTKRCRVGVQRRQMELKGVEGGG